MTRKAAPAKAAAPKRAATPKPRRKVASAKTGRGGRKSGALLTEDPASSPSLSESTQPAPRPTPAGLAGRGGRLWEALAERVAGEHGMVLLEEACRMADRLDGLARILTGENQELLRVRVDEDRQVGIFVVDAALSEARQQANVLRQLVAALPFAKESPGGEEADPTDWVDGVTGVPT